MQYTLWINGQHMLLCSQQIEFMDMGIKCRSRGGPVYHHCQWPNWGFCAISIALRFVGLEVLFPKGEHFHQETQQEAHWTLTYGCHWGISAFYCQRIGQREQSPSWQVYHSKYWEEVRLLLYSDGKKECIWHLLVCPCTTLTVNWLVKYWWPEKGMVTLKDEWLDHPTR